MCCITISATERDSALLYYSSLDLYPSSLGSSKGLLLRAIRLLVLERKPARALIELVVLANHGLITSEHDAIERRGSENGAACAAEEEAGLRGPGVASVAVKCGGGVVKEGDCDGGGGVGRDVAVVFFGVWER